MSFPRELLLAALLSASAHADVTLRFKNEVKLNPKLPPQMTQAAMKGMATAMPAETAFQWKDGKGASAFGPFRSMIDVGKKQITIWDPAEKRIATTSADSLAGEMSKFLDTLPAEAKAAMAAMKSTTEIKPGSGTRTILGIRSAEREVTIAIEPPPGPNVPPGPMMKMAITLWTAKEEETARLPALRELREYNLWAFATMNPAGSLERMFQTMPGLGEGFGKLVREMQTSRVVMTGAKITMWMPSLAAAMKAAPPGQNLFGEGFDFDAPFLEVTQELTELSADPVPASALAVPEGYKPVAAGDLIKAMIDRNMGK